MDNKEKIRAKYQQKDDEIEVIKAKPKVDVYSTDQRLRVCAYCRVSTDNEEQTSSYELQKAHYDEYIRSIPTWDFVGIYADEGISGTSMQHRDEFNRMIKDCEEGKIDVILTKSVSRFARNTVDTLLTYRKLKGLKNPVRIIFETENIDTINEQSEMTLEIMAMMAQEESHTKSDIMNWSLRERFKRGRFLTPPLFGYRINDDGEYEIQEKEAEIVRLVYSMYVTGFSPKQIAETMQELNYVSNIKGECHWNGNVVRNIIDNERRCGKLISWKTYTPSYLDHKSKKNTGQKDQYFKNNHHEPIIPIEMYEYAMKIKRLYKTAHFHGEIPNLSVIKEGALKGFVPVCRNYPGFTFENYIFASNFAYEFDKNGNQRIRERDLTKGDISDFDLSGYERVNTHLFLNNSYPACWFKYNQMFFNTACLGKMKDSKYIELLFEPHDMLLAIRTCDETCPNAIKWTVEKDGKLKTSTRSCSGFAGIIFENMCWNEKFRYKIVGTKREKGDNTIVLFDLFSAEPIMREFVEIDNESKSMAVNLYNSYYINHFGSEIYDDVYSDRLYVIDYLNKWNLGSISVPIEEEQAWMKEAKERVKIHISKLKEGQQNG